MVIASVPLDQVLVNRLEARSGLERSDHVLLVEDGQIVAGPHGVSGRVDLGSGKTRTVSLVERSTEPLLRARSKNGRGRRSA